VHGCTGAQVHETFKGGLERTDLRIPHGDAIKMSRFAAYSKLFKAARVKTLLFFSLSKSDFEFFTVYQTEWNEVQGMKHQK